MRDPRYLLHRPLVRSIFPYFTASVSPQTLVLPVEDPRDKHLADWSRNRRELGHSRRDVQAAVDEVAEGIDLILRVLLGRGVHLLEFLNQKARRACFGRVEVADFCLELTGSLSQVGGECGDFTRKHLRE